MTIKTICKPRMIYTPDAEYPYNVQLWHSTDGGKTFIYSGSGKFFKDYYAAEDYRKAHRENLAYDLMFGCLGNGITVFNTARRVSGDYPQVAHIDNCGAIRWRADSAGLPAYAREEVNHQAAQQAEKYRTNFLTLPKSRALDELGDVWAFDFIQDHKYTTATTEEIYNYYVERTCKAGRTMPQM